MITEPENKQPSFLFPFILFVLFSPPSLDFGMSVGPCLSPPLIIKEKKNWIVFLCRLSGRPFLHTPSNRSILNQISLSLFDPKHTLS